MIGIDSSYAAIGWALVSVRPVVVVDSGKVKVAGKNAEEKLPGIMMEMRLLMHRLLQDTPSCTLAIENAWLGKNVQVLAKLSELRGAIIEASLSRGCPVVRVDPRSWQTSAGIPMRANREAVKISSISIAKLRAKNARVGEDEADAINIAWHQAGVLRMRASA